MGLIDIVNRIKHLKNLKNDNEVASLLKISVTAFSERKKTGSIPFKNLCEFALEEGVSIDWLLIGENKVAEEDTPYKVSSLLTHEEQEYTKKLIEVLRNAATKKAIMENIDTFLKVPKVEPAPFEGEKKGR